MLARYAFFATLLAGLVAGCNALLDIDHIEFGEASTTTGSNAGGAGGATSGSGGATTNASVGGGAGGGPPPEDCVNGIDDNGDDLIDCDDPLCVCFEAPRPS